MIYSMHKGKGHATLIKSAEPTALCWYRGSVIIGLKSDLTRSVEALPLWVQLSRWVISHDRVSVEVLPLWVIGVSVSNIT